MTMRRLSRMIRRHGLLAGSLLLAPLTADAIAAPVVSWCMQNGLAQVFVALVFVACLLILNRVTLDLYQEFQNRE